MLERFIGFGDCVTCDPFLPIRLNWSSLAHSDRLVESATVPPSRHCFLQPTPEPHPKYQQDDTPLRWPPQERCKYSIRFATAATTTTAGVAAAFIVAAVLDAAVTGFTGIQRHCLYYTGTRQNLRHTEFEVILVVSVYMFPIDAP